MAHPRRDLTLTDLVLLVWDRKLQLIGAMFLGLALGIGVSLVKEKKYTTRATFVGVGGTRLSLPASLGALGALAGQLGIGGLSFGEGGSLSPGFYVALATSDTILSQLATVRLRDSADTLAPPQPFLELLEVRGRSHTDSVQRAVKKLRSMVVIDLQSRTGMIKVNFTARTPYLAAAAADTLLGLLNSFVGRDLRTRAGATRRFLQERLGQIESDLSAQQDKLRAFLEANREYQNSPMLQFRQAELERDLEIKRDLYLSVARSLEEARMNEVRDTPMLSVIDRPPVLLRPSSPKPILNAVILAFFMPLFWLTFVLLRDSLAAARQASADSM